MRKDFTVGFAGRPDEYKGFPLIQQACSEMGVKFKPALDVPVDKMREYYDSVDMVVIASENEGHNTIAMECLALNKPMVTTDVGIPKLLKCHKIERSVEGIKKGIELFYTQKQVEDYSWENICKQFTAYYEEIKR